VAGSSNEALPSLAAAAEALPSHEWFSATVSTINDDGKAHVAYKDGD
jgi:hypothetical protein